jgi:hypothetical protein
VIVPTSHLDPRIVEGTATAGVTVEVIEVDPLEEHELSTLACSSLHGGGSSGTGWPRGVSSVPPRAWTLRHPWTSTSRRARGHAASCA